MVCDGAIDLVMKGNLHTDVFMQALLDFEHGRRLPRRRVSHLYVVDTKGYGRLIGITDAAINITPDQNAKAQICQNAVAILPAVETLTFEIVSTLDAAALMLMLMLMARRGQIAGAILDGPLAFDNAVSPRAVAEKGIVSRNVLAKALEHFGGATAAGRVIGLSAPVVHNSRADAKAARLG